MKPAIFGCSGERLTSDERDFFRDANPVGYIVFGRNCTSKEQLRALTDELRSIHGRDDLPILIDQEGGRVSRLQPPVWPEFPPARRFADLYQVAPISAIEAARVNAQAIALTLRDCGINVDCLPVLDIPQEDANKIIGERALGSEPMQVAALGRAVLEGLAAGGVVGVVKHMPGHGRSRADSHVELPMVDATDEELEWDLRPFRTLRNAPMGMVAHILYTAWDPERPASLSAIIIDRIIRGRIGFEGFLMSDDIGMHALTGDFGGRAEAVVKAGCDAALHCSGDLPEMIAVADALGDLAQTSSDRLAAAMALTEPAAERTSAYEELAAKRDALLAYAERKGFSRFA